MCAILCICGNQNSTESEKSLESLSHRGPDQTISNVIDNIFFGFHRLSIIDKTSNGMQPFDIKDTVLVCNGEIFNSESLKDEYKIQTKSKSDCEVIVYLYRQFGMKKTIQLLDGEFAFVLYDKLSKQLFIVRDPLGVRPLFIGYSFADEMHEHLEIIGIASEMKALSKFPNVEQVISGHYLEVDTVSKSFNCFQHFRMDIMKQYMYPFQVSLENYQSLISLYLKNAVKKRLISDAPIGAFLSGGLDSSLISSIAYSLNPDMHFFTIGLKNSVDVYASKSVVKFLKIPKSHHHIVEFTVEQGFDALFNVIQCLESYDITTVRASIPQYLLSEYISKNTDIKVLLSGEGADELFSGYIYSRNAPTSKKLRKDSIRLLEELMYFDNLRTDRTTAAHGLEVRAPFLDKALVQLIMHGDPILNMCDRSIEKELLRSSFRDDHILPYSILNRRKEAFSDAVSSSTESWYISLVSMIEPFVSNQQMIEAVDVYPFNTPMTKEAYFYRSVFEKFYPEREMTIPHFWMPRWQEDDIVDPSATILKAYV